MADSRIKRELLPGGGVQLSSDGCTFEYRSPRPNVLFVTISGLDSGQFGTVPLNEINVAIAREGQNSYIECREFR